MYIISDYPDPYPGRCGCIKFNPAIGQYERCLGYDGEPHVCEWENKKPNPVTWARAPKITPRPWVRPGDEAPPVVSSDGTDEPTDEEASD